VTVSAFILGPARAIPAIPIIKKKITNLTNNFSIASSFIYFVCADSFAISTLERDSSRGKSSIFREKRRVSLELGGKMLRAYLY
jgi:hypothetical protein